MDEKDVKKEEVVEEQNFKLNEEESKKMDSMEDIKLLEELQKEKKKNKMLLGIGAVALVGIVGIGAAMFASRDHSNQPANASSQVVASSMETNSTALSSSMPVVESESVTSASVPTVSESTSVGIPIDPESMIVEPDDTDYTDQHFLEYFYHNNQENVMENGMYNFNNLESDFDQVLRVDPDHVYDDIMINIYRNNGTNDCSYDGQYSAFIIGQNEKSETKVYLCDMTVYFPNELTYDYITGKKVNLSALQNSIVLPVEISGDYLDGYEGRYMDDENGKRTIFLDFPENAIYDSMDNFLESIGDERRITRTEEQKTLEK